tara:strand:- start:270 stop:422 length:153 start_codon:yes stop_codon:yes gene_type:complete
MKSKKYQSMKFQEKLNAPFAKKSTNSNIDYDKLTPYDRKRLEGKGCPPSP